MVHYLRKNTLLLKIVHYLRILKNLYYTEPLFLEDTANQILHMLTTLILWLKSFYNTIGQYPTLCNFLAIAPEEISHWNYYLMYHNNCVKPNIFLTYAITTTTVLMGDVT